jgi:glutamyl-tRNA reductase
LIRTCNRLEIYKGDGHVDESIVRHLFRVVSGLESGLIGETSIQNQVKNAYLHAANTHKLSSSLHRLFQNGLKVGKLIRSQTGISRGAMSHSQATVNILRQQLPEFRNANITVLGVHNMNGNLLHHLTRSGASTIFVGNRTYHLAAELADKYGAQAFDFSKLSQRLQNTDVLITATSAPHYVIKKKHFPQNKSMLIFDLAVPNDVDPSIGELQGVKLYNVKTIEKTVEQNIKLRQKALVQASEIVETQVGLFMEDQKRRTEVQQIRFTSAI